MVTLFKNSRITCEAMNSVGCRSFKIPPCSPDLNLIENMLHLIGKQLKKDAIPQNPEHETYEKFSRAAKKTILFFPLDIINRTIESMPKRIDQVFKTKGERTKY